MAFPLTGIDIEYGRCHVVGFLPSRRRRSRFSCEVSLQSYAVVIPDRPGPSAGDDIVLKIDIGERSYEHGAPERTLWDSMSS